MADSIGTELPIVVDDVLPPLELRVQFRRWRDLPYPQGEQSTLEVLHWAGLHCAHVRRDERHAAPDQLRAITEIEELSRRFRKVASHEIRQLGGDLPEQVGCTGLRH